MSEKKELKREIKAVWDAIKEERRARPKSFSATELVESAERLALYATQLKALAERIAALDPATPAAKPKTARAPKAKPKPE